MSQPHSSPEYTWNSQQNRYLEARLVNSQWVQTWMPVDWRPPQQQPKPPTIQQQPYATSGYVLSLPYGSSAYSSSGQAGWGYTATPAAASAMPQNPYNYGTQVPARPLHPSTSASSPGDRNRARSDSHHGNNTPEKRLPKGVGPQIQGHYNAQLGTTPGNLHYEEVDQSYYVRDRKFFVEGKVFAVIFSETAGSTAATSYNSSISNMTEARFSGHFVYTQSRRFVVVRSKREFCFACPIFTYSKRATLKRGVRAEEHGIAYSNGQEPKLLKGEKGIKKPSLAVAMAPGEQNLHIASRIYYGIHHPIQYNVKVKDIGQVIPHHVPALIGNWKAEDEGETRQAPEVTAAAEEPELPNLPEEHEDESGDIPQSPTAQRDPHKYHSKNNVWGYDVRKNPHMYHPTHNPHGYHPNNNAHGYHPTSNACSYHPEYNPQGHHPQMAPFCYHPRFSAFGYHAHLNVDGYHPEFTPFNYHPESNHLGYHPEHNVYGYHPEKNPHGYHPQYHRYGYHPTHNPDAYHPTWKPQGHSYGYATGTVVASQEHSAVIGSGDEEEGGGYEEKEDGEYEYEDPPIML